MTHIQVVTRFTGLAITVLKKVKQYWLTQKHKLTMIAHLIMRTLTSILIVELARKISCSQAQNKNFGMSH